MSAFAKYLILGQGIAGTTLAHTLLQRGESVFIADDGFLSSSSMVAAGIWNPIVFRRMNKSWMADECIQKLYDFYPKIEALTQQSFFHPTPIYRMHGSKDESDLWFEKKSLPGYAAYMKSDSEPEIEGFKKPVHGSCEVFQTGYVDVESYLKSSRSMFSKMDLLIEANLDLNTCEGGQLELGGKTWAFEKIIDCRGSKSAEESQWSFLPFNLTKGEVLTLESSDFNLTEIYNASGFALPISNNKYKVGATFEWKNLEPIPTQIGRDQLTEKVESWTSLPYDVVGHEAGIRPTVKDRKPLIGRHPTTLNLLIFNGLGAKGIMLAPFLAESFADYLLEYTPLDKSFDITRFL